MKLTPLRFKSVPDFESFVQDLAREGHMNLMAQEDRPSYFDFSEEFNTLFLQTIDGEIYSARSVKQFLIGASQEEINQSPLLFLNADGSTLSLRDFSANPDALKYSEIGKELKSQLGYINYHLFTRLPLPELQTIEAIKNTKELFSNEQLCQGVQESMRSISLSKRLIRLFLTVPGATYTAAIDYAAPFHLASFLKKSYLDLLMLCVVKEKQLLADLTVQREGTVDEVCKKELGLWINEIEKNHQQIRALFRMLITFLNDYKSRARRSITQYNTLVNADPDFAITKQELQHVKELLTAAKERLSSNEALFSFLKPTLLYGGVIGLPLLLAVGAIALSATLFLSFLPLALVGAGAALLLVGSLFTWLHTKIDDLCSLSKQYQEIALLEKQGPEAIVKMKFVSSFKLIKTGVEQSIEQFNDAGLEVESMIATYLSPPRSGSVSSTTFGLFNEKSAALVTQREEQHSVENSMALV
jgi:hypothetical protein